MGYDCGDNFPFDFEPNGILFGSKSGVVLSLLSCPIQCEGSSKCGFVNVAFLPESHSKSLLEWDSGMRPKISFLIQLQNILLETSIVERYFCMVYVYICSWNCYIGNYGEIFCFLVVVVVEHCFCTISTRLFLHWEKFISVSFHGEWDVIMVTVFLSILKQIEYCRVPFSVKGVGNVVSSV